VNRTASRLGEEPLGIAPLAFRERRIDEELDELSLPDQLRTICRSTWNREMKAQSKISPASTKSLATSPMRRMFSTRSASEKPRSRVSAECYHRQRTDVAARHVKPRLNCRAILDLPGGGGQPVSQRT
jgi:hypothetical protein